MAAYRSHDIQYQQLKAAHHQTVDNVLRAILDFYMTERYLVLTNLQLILRYSSPIAQRSNQITTLIRIREMLLKGVSGTGLVDHLIAGLNRNLEWNVREFGHQPLDEAQRNTVLDYLQAEQLSALQLLFQIAQEQNFGHSELDIDVAHISKFYNYMVSNDFSGDLKNVKLKYEFRRKQ